MWVSWNPILTFQIVIRQVLSKKILSSLVTFLGKDSSVVSSIAWETKDTFGGYIWKSLRTEKAFVTPLWRSLPSNAAFKGCSLWIESASLRVQVQVCSQTLLEKETKKDVCVNNTFLLYMFLVFHLISLLWLSALWGYWKCTEIQW